MKIIGFAYCDEFFCMADKCPESCCTRWNIFFNRQDYLKVKTAAAGLPEGDDLKEVADGAFAKVNGGGSSDYAVICLDGEGHCPFLEVRLCRLQKELGEEYMGFVCSTFPRLKTKVGDSYIYSCDISCPKVAELMISHRDGLALVTREYDFKDKYLNSGIYSAPAVSQWWEGYPYYWNIKNTQLNILKNRNLTISERMLILGYFSEKANEYINRGEGEKLLSLEQVLKDDRMCGEIAAKLNPKQTAEGLGIKSVGIFTKIYMAAKKKQGEHINVLFQQVSDNIELNTKEAEKGKTDISFNFGKYLSNLKTYDRLEKERPYIIENIMVNRIFTQPLSQGIWKNYFMAAVFYNLIKTCIPAFLENNCSDEALALAISRTAKMIGHDILAKDALLDFVDNRSYTLPHAAFLVGGAT